jgi:hypothetical protein
MDTDRAGTLGFFAGVFDAVVVLAVAVLVVVVLVVVVAVA